MRTETESRNLELGPQIKKTGMTDEVIRRFKDLITRRVFIAGARLPPERELAEALGVSRPTLRQAMKALQMLGVIRCRQGDASYLAESAVDILNEPLEFAFALKGITSTDLFETRQTLEVRLASLAAERRTEGDLENLREALSRMKLSIGVPDEWCVHEIHFHEYIVQAAKNAVMATIMEMLARILLEARRDAIRVLTDYESSFRAHERIFIEIERQNTLGSSQAMLDHFEVTVPREVSVNSTAEQLV